MDFPSSLVQKAVDEIAQLPGIGRRSALRLVLHLLRQPKDFSERLSSAIATLRQQIRYCNTCHNISDADECSICANPLRNQNVLCVVEDVRDVMAIEATGQFKGRYHVLGGKIAPMEGIGPQQLTIDALVERVENEDVREIIFALGSTMEGDTTNYYIFKKLSKFPLTFSVISRGIGVGDELEYADELTLGRSISQRIPFEVSMKS
ncbi:MAG: Recombination protein RecR [Flavobacteriales bacterium]|jgi:recombination protein RecR|nr:MAG: recombination protein RecR [Flavobacteriales bacterium]CAI8302490.1 MAG: Recombination protein RecR [Flavobacteriales bacterium]|tara:strand:- start:1817 stop:2434 length:618 start_codon:yes stop_codon:yes gene_type:complete